MDDPQETRIIPRTWRAYLAEAKETWSVVRWVTHELATPSSKRWLRRLVITLLVATILQAVQPRLVGLIFNGLTEKNFKLLALGLISFPLFIVAQKCFDYFQAVGREWLLGLNWGRLDAGITRQFFEKSLGQHVAQSSKLSVANIDKGRWRLLDLQGMLLFEGIPALLTLLFSFILLWTLSWAAGAIMLLVVAVYLVWMLFLNQRVLEVCTPIDAELRRLNRYLLERWEQVERVKTNAKSAEELESMSGRFDKSIAEDRQFWIWFIGQNTFRQLVGAAGLIAIVGYGAWLVWKGWWQIGLLYPLYSWSSQVVENIWRIGHIEHQLNWNLPSIRAMIEAVSLQPDVVIRERPHNLGEAETIAVTFDAVSHTYPIGEEENGEGESPRALAPVLRSVSFSIGPGQKVALIGPSGSGKTTIMRLLLRFMDPDQGVIRVNDINLRDLDLDAWMRQVGYIPQQAQILDGTLRYNLLYGLQREAQAKFSDDDLWQMMRLLKIDFSGRLTHGLETLVGRHGIKLSGGQAQRVMIGAAAMKRPRFMIIDEATSHLDSATERMVQKGLAEVLKTDVGALIVAHRLSTVRRLCDKFMVLRGSDEVREGESQIEAEAGSFEELYQISPTFRSLANEQGVIV
ncbi:ABC transporter ATP-binding protein [Candidatus Uhrbacteria bacterium]|nr:ABC transporter ATP-binding protein [Candidatus Uhrbacteria bacterium]